MAFTIGDIVVFKTNCQLNGCSGIVHGLRNDAVLVTMPDNETKLAFLYSEVRRVNYDK